MDDILELLNYAYSKSKDCKDDLATYDDDSEAAHEDGQWCGRRHAYKDILEKCANFK